MGGKRGKKRQRSGKRWHGGRQKRQGFDGFRPAPCHQRNGCLQEGCPSSALYAVVQVLTASGGAVVIELKYHKTCGKSRREPPQVEITMPAGRRAGRR